MMGSWYYPQLKFKKLKEEMIWSKGETFGFGCRESEVKMERPSRNGLPSSLKYEIGAWVRG